MTQTSQSDRTLRWDLHQHVTDTIVRQLEAGNIPWHDQWKKSATFALPVNYTTGRKYRGINIVLLWASVDEQQFTSCEWASFKQWHEKDQFVRKGEKGTKIVYYDLLEKEKDGEVEKIPFLKSSVVFNRCQLEGYKQEQAEANDELKPVFETIRPVEEFVANTKAIIEHNPDKACYVPSEDLIRMPHPENFLAHERFTQAEAYYSTLTHELVHWTGHNKRLNREKGKKFGDSTYAREELIAELGAAFLCAELQLPTAEKGNHAAYIASWLKALKDDKNLIVPAASQASKAVDYLQSLQPV